MKKLKRQNLKTVYQIKNQDRRYISADILRLEPIIKNIKSSKDIFLAIKQLLEKLEIERSVSQESFLKCKPFLFVSKEWFVNDKPFHYDLSTPYKDVINLTDKELLEVSKDIFAAFTAHEQEILPMEVKH